MTKTPVVVLAYNRPKYLDKCLNSLKMQVLDRDVYLFIDGPRNQEDQFLIQQSIKATKYHIPHCEIKDSFENLGVAFNTKRARDFIFSKYDQCFIIEDDQVFNSYYLEQLDSLMSKFKDEDSVGMVNMFGEVHRNYLNYSYYDHGQSKIGSYDDQRRNMNKLKHMEHLWGYGMFKSCYEKIYDDLEGYYSLLPREYRNRPHQFIYKYWRDKGVGNKIVSSQDSCTSAAMVINGISKVSTYTNNFSYIGEIGEHSRTKNFKESGWDKLEVFDQQVDNFEWNDNISKEIFEKLEFLFLQDKDYRDFEMKVF